jgi:predicted glycosyltransferase involved in capsule biosynthesis
MAHSRNVAYKAASGDIVTNVDADNFTGPGFADRMNRIANQLSGKNVFLKSYRSTHGRVGFWKEEFVNLLGGYDETFVGYGHDDRDLIFRAMELGFSIARFGGEGSSRISSRAGKVANYDPSGIDQNWRYTEQLNKIISYSNLMVGNLVANVGKEWGKAKLIKNFTEEVIL